MTRAEQIVLFEDEWVDLLNPLTLLRPAYTLLCGGARLIDLVRRAELPIAGLVRPHLNSIQAHDYQIEPLANRPTERLYVNARIAPDWEVIGGLVALAESSGPRVLVEGEEVVCARLPRDAPLPSSPGDEDWQELLRDGPCESADAYGLRLVHRPHELVMQNAQLLANNLRQLVRTQCHYAIREGVYAASPFKIIDPVTTDTRNGPIVLERGVSIGPFCQLSGPIYLGPGTQVQPHSHLKGPIVTGTRVKVGGEVESTVIDSYSNKQHSGFVGHSYVGQWVNLGAGTATSNLKNTYGEIRMAYGRMKIPTGMQFLGSMIADYSRTAVNASLFTGRLVGVASMLYGTITRDVLSFTNAGSLCETTEIPLDVIHTLQERIFPRRGLVVTDAHREALDYAFESTRCERLELVDEAPHL